MRYDADNPVGPHRVMDAVEFSLPELKEIKTAKGTAVNDACVTIIGGALRKYLEHQGRLPEESLIGNMPIILRKRGLKSDEANQVGAMMARIHTEIADPVDRLHKVHDSIADAKRLIGGVLGKTESKAAAKTKKNLREDQTVAHTYSVDCDVEKAFSLLSDPVFINARNLGIGELESDCKVEKQGDKTVLYITRRIARDNVPKALTRIIKPVQTVEFVEEWHREGDSMVGHYKSDVIGMPVKVDAALKLTPTPHGCEYFIEHTAKANIPLVGRLVEKFIISQTGDGVRAEIDYLNEHLG